MSHLLLIGVGPLPFYQSDRLYGFGIRTWQFAKPLLAEGHKITLVSCEFGATRENTVKIDYQISPSVFGDLHHTALPQPIARNTNILLTKIEDLIESEKPDAIIAAGSTIATNLAASLKTTLPMWLDMFGDMFAEVQAKSVFSDNLEEMEFFHRILSRVLLRADRFSVVSEMQRGTAIGQLGMLGRLNRFTLGEELIYTIPCAMDGEISPVRRENILRGKKVNLSDFLILCSGGFNTWADIDTLFSGIEGAMDKNPRIHCVVTGGAISGHHEEGYNRFRGWVAKSTYENRFHLLGWVPNEDVPQITMECNLGVNIDLPIYESVLGSRNRMLTWMQCGLPILTTVTTEISRILTDNRLALKVPIGDAKALAATLDEAARSPKQLHYLTTAARRFAYDFFTYDETITPLKEWCNNPTKASDNVERDNNNGKPFHPIDALWHSWAFPERDHYDPTLPNPYRAVIRTRPQGKSIWRRLWGN